MRQALGNAFIMNIVITIVIVIILMVISSLSYTKAYKVKNMIISTIEENNGFTNKAREQIDANLDKMGYRINKNGIQNCTDAQDSQTESSSALYNCRPVNNYASYRYCIYECKTSKGNYYRATSYMYFDIPVIGDKLEFPVHGETKTFYGAGAFN